MDAHMPAASRRPIGRFRTALRDALVAIAIALGLAAPALAADELPIFDTHLHYTVMTPGTTCRPPRRSRC